ELGATRIAKEYSESQHNGVEFISDTGAMIAAGVSLRFGGSGSVARSLSLSLGTGTIVGTAAKVGLKQLDGKYANLKEDAITGAIDGLSVPLGELAGSGLSKFVGGKLGMKVAGDMFTAKIESEGAGWGVRALSAGIRTGGIGGVFGGLEN